MGSRGVAVQSEILAALRDHNGALSAYGVLETLQKTNPKLAPPTIYRALSALAKRGEIHRIESLNAFMACRCDRHNQSSVLSICDDCGSVEESVAPDLVARVTDVVSSSGFTPKRHVLEVHGRCASCDESEAQA